MVSSKLQTHFLDVGQGETIVMEFPNSKSIGMIDCTSFDKVSNYIFGKIKPEEIYFIIISHPHYDRIRGMVRFLKECEKREIPIRIILQSGVELENAANHHLQEYLKENNYLMMNVRAGSVIPCDGRVSVHVLSPPCELPGGHSAVNNSSIVLLVQFGRSKLLLTGDAELESWAHSFVGQRRWLRAQVLKVPHYGGKHGIFHELLKVIQPKYAIISTSKDQLEEKRFPHPIVMTALDTARAETYCTALHGDILIKSGRSGNHDIITTQNP